MNVGLHNWIKLLMLGCIWGASFMGVAVALEGYTPLTIAALRISLAAICLTTLVCITGPGLPAFNTAEGRIVWLCALLMGVFSNAVPFSLLSWGMTQVASGFAGVTMAVVPLFVLPLAHILIPGDRMSLRSTIGFCCGFVGVVVLIGLDAFASTGADLETLARLACVAAALCYAIGAIVTRLCPNTNMLSLSAAALLCGAVLILPIALVKEGIPSSAPVRSTFAVIALGLIPTALAQVMLVQVIRSAGPAFLSLVNYQVPVWSVIFGFALLAETLPRQLFVALALILGGLLITSAQRKKR
ncbi:Permease of the drug/metabolite transporter (DMT) superfamily [Epibacterium ulvae]|uniref:Permease of the drug/metabolite transporter (DMT) superfamily n=1 Tax=Epibacterium ulvae TaxID=1156985 RepID=A0A1G5R4I4_9RHOB|nr:DMT family transporter [Epibacterium ulvae]SCZ68768.1 Permease of the drug/metabolite transporter (DMT) superfamily [Epibacterium ulvae]